MKYKGIVFDFNGTMVWDTKLHNKAWNKFLEKYNISLSDEEMFEKVHGKNNTNIIRNLFGDDTKSELIDKFIIEKETIYQNLCIKSNIKLATGLIELLDYLKENKIKFAVATASGKFNIDFYFEYFNLGKWVDISKVIYDNGNIQGKPAPDFFLNACKLIGLKPMDVIVFEDSYFGIKSAENARVGKIIVMESNGSSYKKDNYTKIRNFNEFNKELIV